MRMGRVRTKSQFNAKRTQDKKAKTSNGAPSPGLRYHVRAFLLPATLSLEPEGQGVSKHPELAPTDTPPPPNR